MDINATQFPQMYVDLGIDIQDLGCIMLDVEPFEVGDIIAEEDLYYSDYITEPLVGENEPHLTLLFGLLQSGKAMQKHVDTVLGDWELDEIEIAGVTYFESNINGEEYYCIIAEVVVTPMLLEGNQRLHLLPHIDTYPYRPHCTLAYIKKDEAKRDAYIRELNKRYVGATMLVLKLNYGH